LSGRLVNVHVSFAVNWVHRRAQPYPGTNHSVQALAYGGVGPKWGLGIWSFKYYEVVNKLFLLKDLNLFGVESYY
jgi:hypothetical protein